ncbi:hypothetical protein KY084_08035 [Stakelama sp. CBK3Z-3]|uniref:Uncharacterized protein n=1 Tax=Stakelama flava TaxID=2860338 RepID=A0ABS6XN05_9SPHN|nr:hypothetical protein [Stakelama flava]MBW4330825.1 hypothetical protein [Stakelama flava]
MKKPLLVLAALALTSACATRQDDFPSLLPRDIERPDTPVPTPSLTPVAPDAALDAQIAAKQEAFDQAVAVFDAAAKRARPLATRAHNAAIGSDAWIAAQTALADLDTARSALLIPLADLEGLAIDRAQAGKQPYPALEEALETTEAADANRADTLDNIDALVPAP